MQGNDGLYQHGKQDEVNGDGKQIKDDVNKCHKSLINSTKGKSNKYGNGIK